MLIRPELGFCLFESVRGVRVRARKFQHDQSLKARGPPDPQEDPKSKSPNSGLQHSSAVDDRTTRWIYFLYPLRGLGSGLLLPATLSQFLATLGHSGRFFWATWLSKIVRTVGKLQHFGVGRAATRKALLWLVSASCEGTATAASFSEH